MGVSVRSDSLTLPRLAKGVIALIDRELRRESDSGSLPTSAPDSKKVRSVSRWMTLGSFVLLLPLFYVFAWKNGTHHNTGTAKNGDPIIFEHDQHTYLNMARLMRLTDYERVVARHRMPGYPFMLSALYRDSDAYTKLSEKDPRNVSDEYFLRAKHFNILLSLLGVVAIYLLARKFLPVMESHVMAWSFAWLMAVFRAPFVQPEVAFYVLFLWSLVLLWRLLVNPRWWLAGAAALILAGAFILKSTVIPLLALFVAVASVRAAWRTLGMVRTRDWSDVSGVLKGLGTALLVPTIFAVVLLPYFQNTSAMHGSALWDVHSRHYLWMESDEEKRFWRNAGIESPEFSPPQGREVPTLQTYLAAHTVGDMVERLREGWDDTRKMVRSRYRTLDFIVMTLTPLMILLLAVGFRHRTRRAMERHWQEWLLIAGFFLGYGLLYCWYEAIGVGPRLALALYLPALFFGLLAVHRLAEPVVIRVHRWRAPLRQVLAGVLLIVVALGGIGVLSEDLWVVEGGR